MQCGATQYERVVSGQCGIDAGWVERIGVSAEGRRGSKGGRMGKRGRELPVAPAVVLVAEDVDDDEAAGAVPAAVPPG